MDSLRLLLLRILPLALAVPACGGTTGGLTPATDSGATTDATGSPGHRDAATGDDAADPVTFDAGVSCPAPSGDAGFYPFESPASGRLSGPELAATVCNVRASVFVQSYATYPTMTYLELGDGTFQITDPADTSDPSISAVMQIAAAAPGTYRSSDTTNCGNLLFDYSLPVPASVDCGDGSIMGPNCPPGCTSACSGFGCSPCTPNPPVGGYTAEGGGTCFDNSEPAVGSWTITLTSVTPYTGDAGSSQGRVDYTAHGTVTAQLVGGDPDAGSEEATLTLTF